MNNKFVHLKMSMFNNRIYPQFFLSTKNGEKKNMISPRNKN